MPSSAPIYDSHHDYKMDPKYRVSIPVEWRPVTEGTPVRMQLSKEYEMPVIKVFSEEVFDDKFRQVEESSLTPAKKQQIVTYLRMMSRKTTISNQGKLQVPKDWSERIGLKADGKVILAGCGSYYMLCTEETRDRISQIADEIDDGQLGVL